MSLAAVGWAMSQSPGSATQKWVLVALADRHNRDTSRCDPSLTRLAEDTMLSESAVKKALRDLEAAGFIKREARKTKGGASRTNAYLLLMHEEGAPAAGGGGTTRPLRGQDVPPNQEVEPGSEPVATSTDVATVADALGEPPPLTMVDGQNLPWNALREVCNIAEGSPRIIEVATALNGAKRVPGLGIRALAWQELRDTVGAPDGPTLEVCIADLIRSRAALYRRVMGDAHLTPLALRKWWVDLPSMGDGDAMDAARVAVDELRRMT